MPGPSGLGMMWQQENRPCVGFFVAEKNKKYAIRHALLTGPIASPCSPGDEGDSGAAAVLQAAVPEAICH